MSPEDISENVGEFHHCKNLKFENFGEPQLKMMSPELLLASCKDLWSSIVPSTYGTVCLMQLYVIKFIIDIVCSSANKTDSYSMIKVNKCWKWC